MPHTDAAPFRSRDLSRPQAEKLYCIGGRHERVRGGLRRARVESRPEGTFDLGDEQAPRRQRTLVERREPVERSSITRRRPPDLDRDRRAHRRGVRDELRNGV